MPDQKRKISVDHEIIKSCQKGETEGQEKFYQLYGQLIMSICLRYSSNRADAEDIFQESFITIFEKIGQLKKRDLLISWLYKIIISKVIRFYRKKIKLVEVSELNFSQNGLHQEDNIIQALSTAELLSQIQQLPPGYRIVFNLYIMEGFSHKEIAQMIGINEATSRSQLHKAKQLLKKRILKVSRIPTYEK